MGKILSFKILVLPLLVFIAYPAIISAKVPNDSVHVTINGKTEQYMLKLSKPDEPVLHASIKYITVIDDDENNRTSFKTWVPIQSELEAAQDVYIDPENLAAVRIRWDESSGKHVATSGVVNGNQVETGQIKHTAAFQNKSDYIDIGRKLTATKANFASGEPIVVETLIVCDKAFGDIFNHNRQRILDYLTVYFWDINMRYKTLPSSKISFRITGVIVIGSTSGQPFIEEARAPDGRPEFGRILHRFAGWVYEKSSSIPKFDIAVAITSEILEWGGGLAHGSGACRVDQNSRKHLGTAIFNDGGNWGSLTIGAHEIAHVLGAPHDDDPNFPGGCDARGYIMSGGNDNLRFFFSTCSDRTIANFVRSNEGSCLRRLDEPQEPAISPAFSMALPPTMNEQCQRHFNDPSAYVEERDMNCISLRCLLPVPGGWAVRWQPPADNTPCLGGGRCFRGKCRQVGYLLKNVVSDQCALPQNPFAFMALVEMATCPNPISRGTAITPLDTFVLEDSPVGGTLFKTAWSSVDSTEVGDKCVWTGNAEAGRLWTDRCSTDASNQNPWHLWDLVTTAQPHEYLVKHRVTKRCMKQEGSSIRTYSNCDTNDKNMLWQFYNVFIETQLK